MARSRPEVTVCAAVSIDGRIASASGDSRLSSGADLDRLHRLRASSDAVMVGANTARLDDPRLTVRRAGGRSPLRVVVDSAGAVPPGSHLIRTARDVPTLVAVSRSAPPDAEARLSPAEVVRVGEGRVDLRGLLETLHARGVRSVLAEGGGRLNWELVRLGLCDALQVTVCPVVLGGGTSLAEGAGAAGPGSAPGMSLEKVWRDGNEVVLRYSRTGACRP